MKEVDIHGIKEFDPNPYGQRNSRKEVVDMTYDERREIGEYLDIVKKNCERTLRSIELMQNALGEMKCETSSATITEEELRK